MPQWVNNLVCAYVHITRELASEYIPISGVAKLKGNDINIYLLFCYIFLSMRNIPVSIPSNSVWESISLPFKDHWFFRAF